jgi:succinyl-diaminopimelate desuccinylase
VAHQKDEYIIIDDLLKATAIYAQAIYELAK